MALIVGGVARYTVHQSMIGNEVANIIDVHIDTLTGDRADHVESVARRIIEAWHNNLRQYQDNVLTLESVSWVDLDSAGGTVGEVNTSGAITWPVTGSGVGNSMPANVSALIHKRVTAQRNIRNGRMYFASIPESWTSDPNSNSIEASALSTFNGSLTSFLNTLNSGESGYDATMAVVHKDPPPLETGFFSPVNELVADSLLATQRRRLR